MNPRMTAIIWWILSLIPATLTVLFIDEGRLYWIGAVPITPVIRAAALAHPLIGALTAFTMTFAAGLAVAHFWLDRRTPV